MAQMQFSAVILLTLLLLKLLLIPNKVTLNAVMGRARWLMTIGIALLDVQFLLQYTLGLRAMGVTQAVLVNLLLFIPCSWTISLAIITLQGQGNVSRIDKLVGGVTWAFAILLLGIAAAIDGQPLMSDSPELHYTEITVSIIYLTMQGHYAYRLTANLRAMRLDLQNYYDHDMDYMLVWMKYSTIVLGILATMVPLLIFIQRQELAIFALLFFVGIFYLVDTFCNYMISSAPRKMARAEESEKGIVNSEKFAAATPLANDTEAEADSSLSTSPSSHNKDSSISTVHSSLIHKWIERGGFRHSGLTMPAAAEEIGIPRYQLSVWLREQSLTYAAWMTDLRIDEAKRIIKEHPQWTNEAIAQHCGFSDRSYFQKKFKEATGLSPVEYHATVSP